MSFGTTGGNSIPKPTTYLFIDGSNFRQYFNETSKKWFGQEVEFDFRKMKDFFQAEKAFYYDCIDDIKTENETQKDFEIRVSAQKEKLNKIREVEGCHVYLGSLSGRGKKKRQKEVDVLLTVQMMEHAFRGNMKKAVLLSGDKDFRPLVESLVRLGLFVEVVGDQKHISKDLIHSADTHRKLNFELYYSWTHDDSVMFNPIDFRPEEIAKQILEDFRQRYFWFIKKGIFGKDEISIYQKNGEGKYYFVSPTLLNDSAYGGYDLKKMELYIELKWDGIVWE